MRAVDHLDYGASRRNGTRPRRDQTLKIRESHAGGWLRLSLTGDLDVASVPALEHRFAQLRATRCPVSLDLSRVSFIDSTAIHLLVRTFGDARLKRWELHVEPEVSHPVMRLFRLVHLKHFLLDTKRDTRTDQEIDGISAGEKRRLRALL